MNKSIVIGLFLGTIKADDCPYYLFGNIGEMEMLNDCTEQTPVPGQTTETKQKGAFDLGNTLNTYKKCTKVEGTDPADYQMIDPTSCNTDTLTWTLYSDDLCTTKKSSETPDPNEVQIKADGSLCNDVLKQTFKMTKKNGKRDPPPACTDPQIGSCQLFTDDQCATPEKPDGKDLTPVQMATLGQTVNDWFKPAWNTCGKLTMKGSTDVDVFIQCPAQTDTSKFFFEVVEFTGTTGDEDCTNNVNAGNTEVFQEDQCFKTYVDPPLGAGQYVKCKKATGVTCQDFTYFSSCEQFSDDKCTTPENDQNSDKMAAQAQQISTALKGVADTCQAKFAGGNNAVKFNCDADKSITWTLYNDADKCDGDTAAAITVTKSDQGTNCFNWPLDGKHYQCGLPNIQPGPAPPTPGRVVLNNTSNGTNGTSDSATTVGVTMAVASLGVAATLF